MSVDTLRACRRRQYDVEGRLTCRWISATSCVEISNAAATYEAAGVPVADVAGAFHNGEQRLSARLVCLGHGSALTPMYTPNTDGYAGIANEFLKLIQP